MSFGEGNLRKRVEDLEEIVFVLTEENKELSNEVVALGDWVSEAERELAQARMHIRLLQTSELAKLEHIDKMEELVRDLDKCRQHPYDDCYGCEHSMGDMTCTMQFFDRMAKLGIEVE